MPALDTMASAGTLAGSELLYAQVGVAAGDERQTTTGAIKTLTLNGFSADFLSLGAAADYAAMRGLLDLEAGTDFNAYTANLAGLSAMGSTGLMDRTGAGTYTTRTATTAGLALVGLTNPSAITFLRVNADNSVDALSAAAFRTAIGAGSGTGDVVGPASSTNLHIAQFDGTTGKLLKDGGALGTAAAQNTGTSGANLPFLNGTNTWAAAQTFTVAPVFTDAPGSRTALGAAAHDPAIQSVASSATVTPTFADDQVNITAQAAALALANPTGTPIPAWGLVIRIKDNGTARAISYDTQYRAIGVTLPTTTVLSKTLYLGMIYNSTDTKWDVVAVAQEA